MTPSHDRFAHLDPFEERLLVELRDVVAARPTPTTTPAAAHTTLRPSRRPSMRLALSGTGLAAAVAAVAIGVSSGGRAAAAYAVEPKSDGSVRVQISSLKDADGLQQKLRAAGIPAIVDYAPSSEAPRCPDSSTTEKPVATQPAEAGTQSATEARGSADAGRPPKDGSAPRVTSGVSLADDDTATFTLDAGDLKPDQKVLITTSDGTVGSIAMQITQATTASGSGTGAVCGLPAAGGK